MGSNPIQGTRYLYSRVAGVVTVLAVNEIWLIPSQVRSLPLEPENLNLIIIVNYAIIYVLVELISLQIECLG